MAALIAGFQKMETAIGQRDQALREAATLLEQRVADRTRELVATQRALVDAERFAAMGKTSAAIAHEIKNALNGLGMAVELILQDPTNQKRGQRLQRQVVGEIARLRDVIDSLLSFSRTPRIERAEIDLVPVIRAAVSSLAEIIADRRATVRVELPESLVVNCDGHKIHGVLLNLVKNAAESGSHVEVPRSGGARHPLGRGARGHRGVRRWPRAVGGRRARTCSSPSSRPGPTGRASASRPRCATSRRTAATGAPRSGRRGKAPRSV